MSDPVLLALIPAVGAVLLALIALAKELAEDPEPSA